MTDPLAIPQWCRDAAEEICHNFVLESRRPSPERDQVLLAECIENHWQQYLESLPDEATALAQATEKVERLATVLREIAQEKPHSYFMAMQSAAAVLIAEQIPLDAPPASG